ncbi:MAG: ATP-binding protein [Inquilinaceae bacterium]
MRIAGRYTALIGFALVAVMAPVPAGAQEGGLTLPDGQGLIAAGLIAVIALVMLAWLRRSLTRQTLRADHFRAETGRLEAFMASSPEAFCGWSATGATAVSDTFLELLGVERIEVLEDLENALGPSDAAALHGAFARLRETGKGFRMVVDTADGRRRLQVTGRRGESVQSAERFDVLWLADVTDYESTIARQDRHLADRDEIRSELLAMLDTLPVPVWLRRPDLGLHWVNRAYAEALDADGQQAVLSEQIEIAGTTIDADGRGLAVRAQRLGQPQSDRRHIVVRGERRLLALTEQPLSRVVTEGLVAGYAVDETPLEELRAELQRHVDAHAEVLEQLRSAIAIYGPDKRLKFYNQPYVSLWGLDEGWLETQPTLNEVLEDLRARRRLPEFISFPDFKKDQLDQFTSLIESREDLVHLPDGTTLREVVTPHPFGGLLIVQEDVTSGLALERNYNTLMAVQRESLDNLAEGIAVFGSDGRLRLSNPAFAKIWDLDPEDLAGHPHISEILDKNRRFYPDTGAWETQRTAMVAEALSREADHGRLERADGSVLEYASVPLPDGAVLNSFLDVTDSVRVEQALRASNEALETADRLKSEFIANVSYQLRTPLNAIMGFAEILNNQYFGPLNERQAEYTGSVVEASKRLLALINDILDLATIEAGYMALEPKPVDVEALIRSVYDLSHEWAGKQDLRLRMECEPDVGIIEADGRRLKQALFNLVSNAVRFTPPGGDIILAAQRRDDQVRLIVSDTGIGIPEADQERVFGRFEKANAQHSHGGVGLGLALVKSFVELHGGHLEMESRSDTGTRVSCVLPIRAARRDDAPPDLLPDRRTATGG